MHGFIRVASAVPNVHVADPDKNASEIIRLRDQAAERNCSIVCFPELSLTGYSCGDLFLNDQLYAATMAALKRVLCEGADSDIIYIIGMPLAVQDHLLNVALVIQSGKILAAVPKTYLPAYGEFYEQRWFASATEVVPQTVDICGQRVWLGAQQVIGLDCEDDDQQIGFGVEICEDFWCPIPPSSYMTQQGAQIIFNLSASNELAGKHERLKRLIAAHTDRTLSAYVYSSAGFGESSADLVYAGNALIYELGDLLAKSERFTMSPQLVCADVDVMKISNVRRRTRRTASPNSLTQTSITARCLIHSSVRKGDENIMNAFHHTNPLSLWGGTGSEAAESAAEILSIQQSALARRINHIHAKSIVVGVSGGLDSTLALLVAARTVDVLGLSRQMIVGVTMPGFGTSGRTATNAHRLMEELGVTMREISIRDACMQHFADIGHDAQVHDVTYENSQARERTQILMDVANQTGGFVLGTGDLSELALGWCTLGGDQMSMYGINAGIPKTVVSHLVSYIAQTTDNTALKETLVDIVDTPISPELTPTDVKGNIQQQTEDLVGPYELHDFFLYHLLNYGATPERLQQLSEHYFAGKYDSNTIRHWLQTFLRRFFASQFKRNPMPDGPKVLNVGLSPRGDWRMPSDASAAAWLNE